MPKAIKKKVTKKTGLKESEIKGIAVRLLDLIKERKRIFIFTVLVLGVVVISTIAFVVYSSFMKGKAYSFERDAYNYYYNTNLKNPMNDEERWKKALELFQKANKAKSIPVVQFYIGNCYFNLGDYDNAIRAYNEFINKYKREEEMLPIIYQKLASAYIKEGQTDEAAKTLSTLAQFKNGIFKDTALILEARHYEVIGKPEDAVKKYKELVRDFPSSPWSTEAKIKIEMENKETSNTK